MSARIRAHIRSNIVGYVAIFLFAMGGTAFAVDGPLPGQNQVGSADIINGEVKSGDIGDFQVVAGDIAPDSLGSGKIANQSVKNVDLGIGASSSNTIADNGIQGIDVKDDTLTGTDVLNDSLTGADIDDSTLQDDIGARAYALVTPGNCTGTPGTCTPTQSKGINFVTRDATGIYCVAAAGIDANQTPAAVTVDWLTTPGPEGNTSAMAREDGGCGGTPEGFHVVTERQPNVTVDAGGGVNNATVAGPAEQADNVGFTIVIP